MKRARRAAVLCLGAFLALAFPASRGDAAGNGFVKPAAGDKCPVCGMFVAKYPDWVAETVFKDGTYAVFDGAKDLFRYLLDRKGAGRDIAAVYVTDYYAVTPVDASTAFYVMGSDVYGPMGAELVPFRSEQEAREFLKDHQGKRVLRFKEITPDVLRSLP
jgi:nitrous oxide reductase accessory protein NosL